MCVTTSSCSCPMRLSKFQCWPRQVGKKTWPSDVPRKTLLALCGSGFERYDRAAGRTHLPPCCAGVAIVGSKLNAKQPIHFAFIRVDSPERRCAPQGTESKVCFKWYATVLKTKLGEVS